MFKGSKAFLWAALAALREAADETARFGTPEAAVGLVSPVAEQVVSKSFAFNGFKKPGRNNLVSIHIFNR